MLNDSSKTKKKNLIDEFAAISSSITILVFCVVTYSKKSKLQQNDKFKHESTSFLLLWKIFSFTKYPYIRNDEKTLVVVRYTSLNGILPILFNL